MNRRQLIKRAGQASLATGVFSATGALAAGVPEALSDDALRLAPPSAMTDPWAKEFRAALAQRPWLLGYAGTQSPALASSARWEGSTSLRGSLFRNGPAQHEVGDYRYRHWFDGDGMLQRFTLTEQGVEHRGAMIATSKYLREKAAGRALLPTFGSMPPNGVGVTGPDDLNPGNISVRWHADRLLALWEAGSPWDMDPDTLATRGLHSFSDETSGVPFSAHPRIEPDGNLWNFGYASGRLVLWHITPTGKLGRAAVVPVEPLTMVHDFVVTQKHLVILIAPLHRNETSGETTFLDSHEWHPEDPTRVLVVDKNDFAKRQWLELPAQWVFHFGNAWEDRDAVIRFDAARAPSPALMFGGFREVMRGRSPAEPEQEATHHRYRLNLRTGQASEEALLAAGESSEFPSVDPRIQGRRYERVATLAAAASRTARHGQLDTVQILNVETGSTTRYQYPETEIPEEHLIVPKQGGKPGRDFWVVGTTLDWQAEATRLNVFDGAGLSNGPVARATLPYALPLGLHGDFVPAT